MLADKTRKAADIFEERTGKREDFFEIIESCFRVGQDSIWSALSAEEIARMIVGVYKYAGTTANKAVESNIKFIKETQKLGDYNILPEYDVKTFCFKYKAELVDGKIKVIPPKGILTSSLQKYVNKNRAEIIKHLSNKE